MRDSGRSGTKRIAGLVLGLIAITAVALLLARDSGEPEQTQREPGGRPTPNSDVDKAAEMPLPIPRPETAVSATPSETVAPDADGSAVERQPWPRVTPDKAWDSMYDSLAALANGTMNQEQLLTLGFDLVGQVDTSMPPTVTDDGLLKFDLLSDASLGEAALYVALDQSRNPKGLHNFEVRATLKTVPGAFTGEPRDNASTTSLSFVLNLDTNGKPSKISALSQTRVHHTAELRALLKSRGAVAVGGAFQIEPDGATWHQATVDAGGTDDKPSMNWGSSGPYPTDGSLADARIDYMASILGGLRSSSPK